MKKNKRIIIAGGKTGGHLFPGIAVAQALNAQDPTSRILFVGTKAPFEINTLAKYGFAHRSILSRPVKGGSLLGKLWSSILVFVSLIQAMVIIIGFRADFILGVGGFSSFALVLAGRILGRKTAIQEQNAIPGMTNRLLIKIAHTIFISFEQTRGMPVNHKTFWVGNPIRNAPIPDPQGLKLDTSPLDKISPDDFLILVTGGSQGAASINQAFIHAVELTKENKNLFIIHQTGMHSEEDIKKFYESHPVRGVAQKFFHEMPAIQDRADLIITRAGASTLSELSVKGKAAILIPFPHAADDHQTANARNLADKGAALVVADSDLSGELLQTMIQDLRSHPEKRNSMEKAMKSLAMPHGAVRIAGHILDCRTQHLKGEN
ncbi:MAG: undecaprenyldiphospho-muramoylpentapeptide beta-N-acetylglucosaminyltransferase [Desulfobacter sp.]|nr:undecaprenyldiphospho-muramoylpentapeptide beta-N-acetylglucosaminyltransferase [Desulfobacter sp.]WDP85485.1 MAG: undecaprenyldiphospho-muramoylpentapeptide beta-N-acetylglucosaminyltransferase [Desulfobacter sp.]